jgi:hypothetical protein
MFNTNKDDFKKLLFFIFPLIDHEMLKGEHGDKWIEWILCNYYLNYHSIKNGDIACVSDTEAGQIAITRMVRGLPPLINSNIEHSVYSKYTEEELSEHLLGINKSIKKIMK